MEVSRFHIFAEADLDLIGHPESACLEKNSVGSDVKLNVFCRNVTTLSLSVYGLGEQLIVQNLN
jgi:hypothetical protein